MLDISSTTPCDLRWRLVCAVSGDVEDAALGLIQAVTTHSLKGYLCASFAGSWALC